jgi:general secretion pathway protein J
MKKRNEKCKMQNAKIKNFKIVNPELDSGQSSIVNSQRGFTLIELIIAITLVSMIMAIILSGMRLSIRAWETGEERVEVYQMGRVILERMSQEIKSMYPYRYEKDFPAADKPAVSGANLSETNKVKILAFWGENDRLRFTTIAEGINPDIQGKGLREVFYYIDKDPETDRDRLFYKENIVYPHSTFNQTSTPTLSPGVEGEKGDFMIPVSDQIAELKFRYYLVREESKAGSETGLIDNEGEEERGEWVESFSGEDEMREEEELRLIRDEDRDKKKRGKPVLKAIEIKISMYEANPDGTINSEKIISFPPLIVPIHMGKEIKAV